MAEPVPVHLLAVTECDVRDLNHIQLTVPAAMEMKHGGFE